MGEIPWMSFLVKSLTKTEQKGQLCALMPEELVESHPFSLLWIAHLYKKQASSGTVREFCEFSGMLGFSAVCFLTVCVRQYFFGFFHTFQLLLSIYICSILLFSPTLTVPELILPLECLYCARGVCVWYQVACSNFCWSPVQELVKTWPLAYISPHYGFHWFVLCVFPLFLFHYFALFETGLQKDFDF